MAGPNLILPGSEVVSSEELLDMEHKILAILEEKNLSISSARAVLDYIMEDISNMVKLKVSP